MQEWVSGKEKLSQLISNGDIGEYFVSILNIDNFKNINNNFGHSIGDRFLEIYEKKLAWAVGDAGYVYRFNGDEFIILFKKNKIVSMQSEIKKIQNVMNETICIDGCEVIMTCSFGIHMPYREKNVEDIIRKAYIALHQAKQRGKNQYSYYSQKIEDEIKRRTLIFTELQKTIKNNFGEFNIVYQPIYSVGKNRIEEVEALLRWENKKLRRISPAEFIPVAEETGIIRDLGYWCIEKVLGQINVWEKQGLDLKVAINLSPTQIEEQNFGENIKRIFKQAKTKYEKVKFEITETQILSLSEENRNVLKEFIELGIDIAIDDFGEGYSSMKNMLFLPVNEIKIDKCFISEIHEEPKMQILVSELINFSHKMGYKIIAEGVECKEQFDMVKKYGCDKIQGYYIKQPMESREIGKFVDEFMSLC